MQKYAVTIEKTTSFSLNKIFQKISVEKSIFPLNEILKNFILIKNVILSKKILIITDILWLTAIEKFFSCLYPVM